MCGRTHGQFAEPVTLGLKFARFHQSGIRTLKRLSQAKSRMFVGQISGAVGTYSSVTPAEEEKILGILGLKSAGITSQVIPRDIFAEYIFIMALICALAEEIALEIRLLAQDGIKEVTEPFTKKQTGSSAMPHKKNPVICERICGLSRMVRSYTDLSLSNIALWNERDISHSSNERIMMEEASALTYYILQKLEFVISGIDVHKPNINANIKKAGNKLFSSGVLKIILDKGASRKEAYSITQKLFIRENSIQHIKTVLKNEAGLTEKEVKKAMSFEYYLENVNKIYKRLGL